MLRSGTDFEIIAAKIAALQTELELLGSTGLHNLNKHCEGFVARLLNLTYQLNLENLNKFVVNYPGLDLGDKKNRIAYQVTSESTTDKIEDSLDKVIRYKHYETFSDIRFFLLKKKQKAYPITLTFPSGFTFDPKTQISNFADLIKFMQYLPFEKLREIREFVETETMTTIGNLKENSAVITKSPLIDILGNLVKTKMNKYEHWSCKITATNLQMSAPVLFKKLNEFFTTNKKEFVRIINPSFQESFDVSQVTYHQPPRDVGAVNHFHEFALKITNNTVHFEFAQYKSGDILVTNLRPEMGACLSLLFFFDWISSGKGIQAEVEIDLACSDKLAFFPQNSIHSVQHSFSVHYLEQAPFNFSTGIVSLDDEALMRLMERIIHGFVAEPSLLDGPDPFLSINEREQKLVFDQFRKLFGKGR